MECPICCSKIISSSIGSCTHHFCTPCLIKWCEFGGTHCPVCMTLIREIRADPQFDELNSPESIRLELDDSNKKITVNFEKNDSAGITLINNTSYSILGARSPGVIIQKIKHSDKCYKSGLRKNDIILYINNIPCMDHKQSIEIINSCINANGEITCTLLNIKNVNE